MHFDNSATFVSRTLQFQSSFEAAVPKVKIGVGGLAQNRRIPAGFSGDVRHVDSNGFPRQVCNHAGVKFTVVI